MNAAGTERRDFIAYPTNRVVGTVGDARQAEAAIDALLRAGFDRQHIDILHGEQDLHRLDPTGAAHGFLAQFHRTLIRTFELEEFKHLTHHVADVRAGRYVIMVLTRKRALRIVAADVLHQHGAEYVGFYGRWSHADLPATATASPADIPLQFARAWNDRDADALASLFDEDAEFVNVSGLRWHDRESIRKAYASRLKGVLNKSTLAVGETKVKLLTPDVAVVHARMIESGGEPAGTVNPPGTGTTIASFVVHRVKDRWLCAAVHNTDVILETEAGVIGQVGVIGAANTRTDRVS
jgi:uncharacterized protein (TIGR02246 family)